MHNRVDLMINKDCNIKCKFCYHHGFQNENYDFSEYTIDKILKKWNQNQYDEVYISWWEPTISPNFTYSLKRIKHYWYKKVKIMTNGLLFSKIDFCKKLKALWVTHLAISMHWYNKNIYEYHTDVENTYEKFLRGLCTAHKFFHVEINSVITNQNIKNLKQLWYLIDKIGIKNIHLQHVVPNSKAAKNLCLEDEEVRLYINEFLENFHQKMNITLEFFPYCLINKKFSKNLWKFSFKNEFTSNNSIMFDNWADGIAKNKVKRWECKTCEERNSCNGFWY